MKIKLLQITVLILGLMAFADSQAAADSYRFLHVTIETPWAIFIFLLGFILTPFVLMAALYWYFAFKKGKEETVDKAVQDQSVSHQTTLEKTSE
jgi:heme/copper-type cytochrome/quinol oxidase subunit 4